MTQIPKLGKAVYPSSLDIATPIIDGLKHFSHETPILPKSIKIYGDNKNFKSMLESGTKLLDALAYITKKKDTDWNAVFDLLENDKGNRLIQLNKTDNIPGYLMVLFIGRGSLPSLVDNTPLPAFIANDLGEHIKTCSDFMSDIASFDPKFLKLDKIFDGPLPDIDSVLKNRLILGVAGHKPLKLSTIVDPIKLTGDSMEVKFVKLLRELSTDIWPNLHPSNPVVSTKFTGFYRNAIHACWKCLGGDDDALRKVRATNMFKQDPFLKDEEPNNILNFSPMYGSWDLAEMRTMFGSPWKHTKTGDEEGK